MNKFFTILTALVVLTGSICIANAASKSVLALPNLGPYTDGYVEPNVDNTIDLGTSTKEFRNLYIGGTAKIDTLTIDENVTVAGTLDVTGDISLGTTTLTVVAIADISVTSPTLTGQLRYDLNSNDLYISTSVGTTGSWQKIGDQN